MAELVFIGGPHRSGTSLLHRLIATHPDASAFSQTSVSEDEGQHLQSVYRPAKEHGGPGKFAFASDVQLTGAAPRFRGCGAVMGGWEVFVEHAVFIAV